MRKICALIAILLSVAVCAGCAKVTEKHSDSSPTVSMASTGSSAWSALPFTLDANNRYTGFDSLPSNDTPAKALADGCFVVTGSAKGDTGSVLYGGAQRWFEFCAAVQQGKDASLRQALFLDGKPYYCDLFYVGGQYRYFDRESDLTDRPFRYLRRLSGADGIPQQQRSLYVLTDSEALTYEDVKWSFLSSNTEKITKIPFVWLPLTTYLDSAYSDITPPNMQGKGFTVLKNKTECDSFIRLAEGDFPLGCGFGGFGVCDIKYAENGGHRCVLFTYSWGSGLHRSHVGVFDLDKKETVFTSDAFMNMDVMLSGDKDGRFDIYQATVKTGADISDLTLSKGKKLAMLRIEDGKFEVK